jgi:hypothetical protein
MLQSLLEPIDPEIRRLVMRSLRDARRRRGSGDTGAGSATPAAR